MASELGILSLPELQNFVQFQQQQSQPIIWNLKQVSPQESGDISWEVKAFEQDSNNVTWPPRSYTCTFCTREFRSAQALGGHMNVHRRDRARLHHQTLPPLPSPPPPQQQATNNNNPFFTSSNFLFQAQEVVTNDGVCIVYSLPKHNGTGLITPKATAAAAVATNSCTNSPSKTLISTTTTAASNNFDVITQGRNNFYYQSNSYNNTQPSTSKVDMVFEEVDLELRLGQRI